MLGTFHLTALYEILRDIHFLYEPEKIYAYLLENFSKVLDAEAASIFEVDSQNKKLSLRASVGPKKQALEMVSEELSFPFGKGVCGWVAQYNKPVIVDDARKDERFNPQVDTLTGYKTKSILCAPFSNKDEVYGVIEILNKKAAAFNKNDLDLVSLIAKQTAIALENAKLYSDLTNFRILNEGILSNLTGGIIVIDTSGNITHFNPSAEKILQLENSDSIGKKSVEVLKGCPAIQQILAQFLDSKEKKTREQFSCQTSNGQSIHIEYSTFLLQNPSRKILGAGMIFQSL